MPAKSKAQQRFFGMVHAYQKGELENPSKEIKDAAESISKKDAKKFAETKHKGLPNHVKKDKKKTNESKVVRLTEGDIRKMVTESIMRILKEWGSGDEFTNAFNLYSSTKAFENLREELKNLNSDMSEAWEHGSDEEITELENMVKDTEEKMWRGFLRFAEVEDNDKNLQRFIDSIYQVRSINEELEESNAPHSYRLVDESDDAVLGNYADDIDSAIADAEERQRMNKIGRYLVVDENDEIVYDTNPNVSGKFYMNESCWYGKTEPFQQIQKAAEEIMNKFEYVNDEDYDDMGDCDGPDITPEIYKWAKDVAYNAEYWLRCNSNNCSINGGEDW